MSRLAKKPIELPKGTEVKFENNQVVVKGSKGQLTLDVKDGIEVKVEENNLWVSLKEHTKLKKAFLGRRKAFELIQ